MNNVTEHYQGEDIRKYDDYFVCALGYGRLKQVWKDSKAVVLRFDKIKVEDQELRGGDYWVPVYAIKVVKARPAKNNDNLTVAYLEIDAKFIEQTAKNAGYKPTKKAA